MGPHRAPGSKQNQGPIRYLLFCPAVPHLHPSRRLELIHTPQARPPSLQVVHCALSRSYCSDVQTSRACGRNTCCGPVCCFCLSACTRPPSALISIPPPPYTSSRLTSLPRPTLVLLCMQLAGPEVIWFRNCSLCHLWALILAPSPCIRNPAHFPDELDHEYGTRTPPPRAWKCFPRCQRPMAREQQCLPFASPISRPRVQ